MQNLASGHWYRRVLKLMLIHDDARHGLRERCPTLKHVIVYALEIEIQHHVSIYKRMLQGGKRRRLSVLPRAVDREVLPGINEPLYFTYLLRDVHHVVLRRDARSCGIELFHIVPSPAYLARALTALWCHNGWLSPSLERQNTWRS
jgi:hypothetical protein